MTLLIVSVYLDSVMPELGRFLLLLLILNEVVGRKSGIFLVIKLLVSQLAI